jgi:hypothetical protein
MFDTVASRQRTAAVKSSTNNLLACEHEAAPPKRRSHARRTADVA